MAKMSAQMRVEAPVDAASQACRSAITQLRWRQDDEGDANRIVAKPGLGMFSNPSKIEMLLSEDHGGTAIAFNASIMQIGPIAKRNLRKQLAELQSAIESSARE
jgi:hypothetical protein